MRQAIYELLFGLGGLQDLRIPVTFDDRRWADTSRPNGRAQ
jgi:hypothetical protein